MPRKPKQRIYVRDRSGTARYYGDFRDYSDVGGGQEALIPEGMNRATDDPEVAEMLASDCYRSRNVTPQMVTKRDPPGEG